MISSRPTLLLRTLVGFPGCARGLFTFCQQLPGVAGVEELDRLLRYDSSHTRSAARAHS
jgi:hypothetical protein